MTTPRRDADAERLADALEREAGAMPYTYPQGLMRDAATRLRSPEPCEGREPVAYLIEGGDGQFIGIERDEQDAEWRKTGKRTVTPLYRATPSTTPTLDSETEMALIHGAAVLRHHGGESGQDYAVALERLVGADSHAEPSEGHRSQSATVEDPTGGWSDDLPRASSEREADAGREVDAWAVEWEPGKLVTNDDDSVYVTRSLAKAEREAANQRLDPGAWDGIRVVPVYFGTPSDSPVEHCPICDHDAAYHCTRCGETWYGGKQWPDSPEREAIEPVRHEDGNPHESHPQWEHIDSTLTPWWACAACGVGIEDDEALEPCEPAESEGETCEHCGKPVEEGIHVHGNTVVFSGPVVGIDFGAAPSPEGEFWYHCTTHNRAFAVHGSPESPAPCPWCSADCLPVPVPGLVVRASDGPEGDAEWLKHLHSDVCTAADDGSPERERNAFIHGATAMFNAVRSRLAARPTPETE